jgi:hypothetical protein
MFSFSNKILFGLVSIDFPNQFSESKEKENDLEKT